LFEEPEPDPFEEPFEEPLEELSENLPAGPADDDPEGGPVVVDEPWPPRLWLSFPADDGDATPVFADNGD
jgi:hypothetical protein